jgi:hypothetical protein
MALESEAVMTTMCDEREELIGYIYGETGLAARQRVEAHLADCHVCRAEVSGLRSVRDDLLAWDIPRHESVWRPFVPAPVVPLWRQVPAWALAAAATLLFATGAAGGMATRMWSPASARTTLAAVDTASPETASRQTALGADELARIEEAILNRVRSEMDARIQSAVATVATSPQTIQAGTTSAQFQAFSQRLAEVERWKDDQISLNVMFDDEFGRLNSRTSNLTSLVQRSALQPVGFEGGR